MARPSSLSPNTTPTPDIYTLSLHDALPIFGALALHQHLEHPARLGLIGLHRDPVLERDELVQDRKSTRLNSSHLGTSYAVVCLKKKTPEQAVDRCTGVRQAACARTRSSLPA